MELSGKDFMKLCEMYIGIKFDEPDTRMKGTTAKRVQCVMGSGGQSECRSGGNRAVTEDGYSATTRMGSRLLICLQGLSIYHYHY